MHAKAKDSPSHPYQQHASYSLKTETKFIALAQLSDAKEPAVHCFMSGLVENDLIESLQVYTVVSHVRAFRSLALFQMLAFFARVALFVPWQFSIGICPLDWF